MATEISIQNLQSQAHRWESVFKVSAGTTLAGVAAAIVFIVSCLFFPPSGTVLLITAVIGGLVIVSALTITTASLFRGKGRECQLKYLQTIKSNSPDLGPPEALTSVSSPSIGFDTKQLDPQFEEHVESKTLPPAEQIESPEVAAYGADSSTPVAAPARNPIIFVSIEQQRNYCLALCEHYLGKYLQDHSIIRALFNKILHHFARSDQDIYAPFLLCIEKKIRLFHAIQNHELPETIAQLKKDFIFSYSLICDIYSDLNQILFNSQYSVEESAHHVLDMWCNSLRKEGFMKYLAIKAAIAAASSILNPAIRYASQQSPVFFKTLFKLLQNDQADKVIVQKMNGTPSSQQELIYPRIKIMASHFSHTKDPHSVVISILNCEESEDLFEERAPRTYDFPEARISI